MMRGSKSAMIDFLSTMRFASKSPVQIAQNRPAAQSGERAPACDP
jgi:hypothetical protein